MLKAKEKWAGYVSFEILSVTERLKEDDEERERDSCKLKKDILLYTERERQQFSLRFVK